MATTAKPSLRQIPEHVAADRVWQGNFAAFASSGPDPFRRVGELHEGPDILWVRDFFPGAGGMEPGWLLTRHAQIREVLSDTENFRSGDDQNMLGAIGLDWPLIPLELDPPQQQRYRKVLEPFFAPAAIDRLDAAIEKACAQLIADFADPGGCEFIGDFAEKFPSVIFLDLMGMPRERLKDFLAWERGMLRGATPEVVVGAMTHILDYLRDFLGQQRNMPASPLMAGILNARLDDGQPLSADEQLSICYLLYIGGLDTVYSTIGWIFWHLAQDIPLQDRLRSDPAALPRATEELLRAFSAASTARRVKHDMMFHGVQMVAGDRIKILLSLGSRDPEVYEDPHRIDIDRNARHLAFGTGPHTCLGLRLAKREIKVVLQMFLARFKNIRMPEGMGHEFHVGSVFGIDRLPLEWISVVPQICS